MRVLLALAVLVAGLAPPTAEAQTACRFTLGFQALRELIPERVGACLEDESYSPATGDALQRTTAWHGQGGLLVWRKCDNWTAFTDGATTWINGPDGVVTRPNTGPLFPWESAGCPNPAPQPAVPTPVPTAPPTAPPGGIRACSVVLPGRELAAVFQLAGPVRPTCETWARALTDRLRSSRVDNAFCDRIRSRVPLTDDTCRNLRGLVASDAAVVDQAIGRGVLVCSGAAGDVRFAVLDASDSQVGPLFCTVLEDSGVKTIRT